MPDTPDDRVRRARLIDELIDECQAMAPERIDRYLRAKHHGIVASTPFAPASAECIELFRDGHFYAAISLAQAVGEALVRHMCESNKWSPAKAFEENVEKLKTPSCCRRGHRTRPGPPVTVVGILANHST